MALVVKDRVQETSTTTGTGSLTLGGSPTGFQTFSSAIGNGNTTYYAINLNSEWEVGIGTVSAGALSRDTVLESSNSGSLVNFSAGTKLVFCTYPAERSVTTDAIGVTVQAYDVDTTKNDVANTFTANQVISVTDNTNAALRVTQLGTGNALIVEDSTNPDSTPFIVDAKGNVGVGETPNASWDAGGHIDFPNYGGIWSSGPFIDYGTNGYYNGSNWIRKSTGVASAYTQQNGSHIWYNAVSASAGSTISWLDAARITTNNNLLVGTVTEPTGPSTTNSIVSAGAIYSGTGTNGGFYSSTYSSNVSNNIWAFGNASNYGLKYFQGTSGTVSCDTIAMPFGQTTSAASHYQFVSNGSTKCGLLMPNHPAFCAGIASTSDATVNTSAYVPFNTVTGGFNTGGYFNTSTYLFTAPFDGVYSFTFNLFFTGSGGATYTQQAGFYVNGAFKSFTSGDAYGCCSYNATTYVGEFSCTMIYKLAAGDTVGVRPRSTNIRIYQGHCSFTGQLVG